MKTIISLVFASLFVSSFATAQIPPYLPKVETVTAMYEEAPLPDVPEELTMSGEFSNAWFPGFKAYVRDNIRYPVAARETGLEGVVRTEAIVRTDGRLTDIRITDGLSYSCDKEVQRLLSGMPAWKPARRNGEPVEQKVYVQVRFKLKSL